MALADDAALNAGQGALARLGSNLGLLGGAAAIIGVMAAFWIWSQQPDYRILFSNYSDKDGGAIVASLEQMNVPYKFSDSGSAILVPAAQVHEARLKLAASGLPKGGNIGFEVMEGQKFGTSQFIEQVNFQRAMEGELEKTVQSIGAVEAARIHLAIPKPSVFVRDAQNPTASVMLNLRAGRSLDQRQVAAIVHLVASSIPNLPAGNVTVVDQNGNLLSDTSKRMGPNNLDPEQIKYIDEIQQRIAKRVESIIIPIVGQKNVRAEVAAEIDFTSAEVATESYQPNQKPEAMAIRSAQTSEAVSTGSKPDAAGVPGALSNQPPPNPTAPVVAPAANPATASAAPAPSDTQKNNTTNYELDKTVKYTQMPMGGVKRLNVAVVVNDIAVIDKKGKTTYRKLTDDEKTKINDLTMQAMGYNKDRGDTIAVVNTAFAKELQEVIPETPIWKNPQAIEYGKDALKFIAGIVGLFLIYRRALKPLIARLMEDPVEKALREAEAERERAEALGALEQKPTFEQSLGLVKQVAKDNPKLVAGVLSGWANG